MRNNLTPLRPGLTAIAAVLALSATPAFAQEAQIAPAQDAPVVAAPPVTDAAPAPVESVTTENTAVPLASPAPTPMATQSTPVIHTTSESATAEATPVTRSTPLAKARLVAPRAAQTSPALAPIAVTKTLAAGPASVAVAKTSTVSTSTTRDDSREIELAGAGALALILLGGGAVAFSRRRRDDESEAVMAPVTRTIAPAAAPVAYEAVETAPVIIAPIEGAPTTALHSDFDLLRYGVHVQAAYRGPTEDNPSLSLRHRLKRARFMDQRARETGEYAIAEAPIAAERKPVTQNLFGSKLKDGLRALRPQGSMRPAFG